MDAALTFIFLLRCCCVSSLPGGASLSPAMVFSDGMQLLVDGGEEDDLHQNLTGTTGGLPPPSQRNLEGSSPSVHILSSVPLSQDPEAPQLLVCILTGLNSPLQDVLWWVDDTAVTSSDTEVSWTRSEGGGAYSATSVWEVSAADWSPKSAYWCGTIQQGQVFRRRVCSRDSE